MFELSELLSIYNKVYTSKQCHDAGIDAVPAGGGFATAIDAAPAVGGFATATDAVPAVGTPACFVPAITTAPALHDGATALEAVIIAAPSIGAPALPACNVS